MVDVQFVKTPGITKAVLDGRLDTAGVNDVEIRFVAGIVPLGTAAIVDLTRVSFVASLGIRMLLSTARSLRNKGAKLALFGATPNVMEIIESTALSDIIPVLRTEDEAIAAVA